MAYTEAEARQELLEDLAAASDEIALALAYLGEAYEQLDEDSGGRLEEQLFRPVQLAYGRAKRTYAEFAGRYGLQVRPLETKSSGLPSQGPKDLLERTVEASERADQMIATLQDSMMPVEVGDPELRAGLSQTRALIADVPGRAHGFVRTFGR